jgi:hypothetical protein
MTSENEVKRYDSPVGYEDESKDGDLVKLSDYQTLQKRLKKEKQISSDLCDVSKSLDDKLNKAISIYKHILHNYGLMQQDRKLIKAFLKEVEK